MKIETKIYILVASVIVALSLFAYLHTTKKNYHKEVDSFKVFKRDSAKLLVFKKETLQNKKVMQRIKTKFNLVSYQNRGKFYKIVFKDLTKRDFLMLVDMLMNSNLYIRELDIKKIKDRVKVRLGVDI